MNTKSDSSNRSSVTGVAVVNAADVADSAEHFEREFYRISEISTLQAMENARLRSLLEQATGALEAMTTTFAPDFRATLDSPERTIHKQARATIAAIKESAK